jgi:hypothetical protein
MPPQSHVTFRLPAELLDKVDAYAEQLAAETGLPVKRADALRMLIAKGLQMRQEEEKQKK